MAVERGRAQQGKSINGAIDLAQVEREGFLPA